MTGGREKHYPYHEGGEFAGRPVDEVFRQIYENARWRVAKSKSAASDRRIRAPGRRCGEVRESLGGPGERVDSSGR